MGFKGGSGGGGMKEEEEEEKFLGLLAWSAGPEGPDDLCLTLDLSIRIRI